MRLIVSRRSELFRNEHLRAKCFDTCLTNSPPHLYQYGWVPRVFGPTSLRSATKKERNKVKKRRKGVHASCKALLTWSTSCRKEGGSTQLMRRSSRSIMAEASICFSTRPIKPSFFFRKAITYKEKSHHFWLELCTVYKKNNKKKQTLTVYLFGFPGNEIAYGFTEETRQQRVERRVLFQEAI